MRSIQMRLRPEAQLLSLHGNLPSGNTNAHPARAGCGLNLFRRCIRISHKGTRANERTCTTLLWRRPSSKTQARTQTATSCRASLMAQGRPIPESGP
jgi:hypothetical protein